MSHMPSGATQCDCTCRNHGGSRRSQLHEREQEKARHRAVEKPHMSAYWEARSHCLPPSWRWLFTECLDNNAFYEQKVWTQVVSKNCLKCHAPEGVAANKNAKFIQLRSHSLASFDINLQNISRRRNMRRTFPDSVAV